MRPKYFLLGALTVLIGSSALIISCTKDLDCETCPCPACPRIDELIPHAGITGDTIMLRGVNFSTKEAGNEVKFNGLPAVVVGRQTTDTLFVIVPASVVTGTVKIKVDGDLESAMIPDHVFPVFTVLGTATTIVAGSVSQSGSNLNDGIAGVSTIDSICSMVPDGLGGLLFIDAETPSGSAKLRKVSLISPYVLSSTSCGWPYTTSVFHPSDAARNVTTNASNGSIYTIEVNDSFAINLRSTVTLGCSEQLLASVAVDHNDTVRWGEPAVVLRNEFGVDWLYFFESYRVPNSNQQAFELKKVPTGGGNAVNVGDPGPFQTLLDYLHITDMEITADGTVFMSVTCEDTDQSYIFRRMPGETAFRRILYVQGPLHSAPIMGIAVKDNDLDHPYYSEGNTIKRIETLGNNGTDLGTGSLVAGNVVPGYEAGAGLPTNARFRSIGDIDVVGNTMLVADQGNHVIRSMELPN